MNWASSWTIPRTGVLLSLLVLSSAPLAVLLVNLMHGEARPPPRPRPHAPPPSLPQPVVSPPPLIPPQAAHFEPAPTKDDAKRPVERRPPTGWPASLPPPPGREFPEAGIVPVDKATKEYIEGRLRQLRWSLDDAYLCGLHEQFAVSLERSEQVADALEKALARNELPGGRVGSEVAIARYESTLLNLTAEAGCHPAQRDSVNQVDAWPTISP